MILCDLRGLLDEEPPTPRLIAGCSFDELVDQFLGGEMFCDCGYGFWSEWAGNVELLQVLLDLGFC